ncbi:Dynein light chain 2, cytoplasmic [Echinococcus granulosus]|uniref:Dynein light chain n=1 Tax=Echinococcus granulosus TaxID=6210 RepID=U6JD45_ECHGR|nr:Dynein light chain 2, cytoplasmic [Echinococcus granulosus]EUB59665.1 Dynein light chain 2, cytoplasmic [Echinococcus granulosus]KAH9280330.1 Dynein light chain 2, cytoplasmic [Echinococcus granulosus]CDS21955.1 dynein light chain [Echinococcus granulosus]
MSYVKAKVNQSDMKESMQQEVVDICAQIMCDPEITPVQVATEVRKYFDEHHGASWTCIVGRDFSSSFAYEKKKHISLDIGGQQILLFKSA